MAGRNPVIHRYRDGYRVASFVVGFGDTIKIVGLLLAVLIFIGSLDSARGLMGSATALVGVVIAAAIGAFFWICGVLVSAQGQILRAALDSAVASSPFLTNSERADAMGVPGIATPRAAGTS